MPEYLEMTTPEPDSAARARQEGMDAAEEEAIRVEDSPNKYESMPRFEAGTSSRASDSLSPGQGMEAGRSVARVYVPTLQERVHVAMLGPFGLALEVINFALSMLIFLAYIAELYNQSIYYSDSRTAVEMIVTSFFIFDFGLNMFIAAEPWKFVFSARGMIDLVTIIPSLIVFIRPGSRSNLMFVFRVLRIFRILRVLRLARYIKFKKHGFEYELGVFILSTIAVILCAAGIYQALESDHYGEDEKLQFHDSLYFVLVTVSTIGYGDITPRTLLGHIFVIVMIIGIFTIVPAEVNKLNELAKQSNAWDKEVDVKSTGHVIVSGTLILNLIRSYHLGQYAKRRTWGKAWIHEYLDGLTYQIFPIIFSSRFDHRKFGVVARHIYENSFSNGNQRRRYWLYHC
ncbi:Calcium-activated potassium channel slowpoke [Phytophthora cinnamomi]|uniref:Calcium-activated potassium channel slowpoke n=1 Tax=Phytophthora cinnamomi TaxID=4785 RepID=UPI003559A81B|nr:Calcium-activated potassium channel slowpoke [Phytophthora cinnamomi]